MSTLTANLSDAVAGQTEHLQVDQRLQAGDDGDSVGAQEQTSQLREMAQVFHH